MKNLLSLCASELLAEFARGSAAPAAGSAAALTGALAASLVRMVARLTTEKGMNGSETLRTRYGPYLPRVEEIARNADQLRSELETLVQADAELVEAIVARRRALAGAGLNDELVREALDRRAVELPLQIARTSIRIAEYADELSARGYQSAAEDARAALALALTAGRIAVALADANLESVGSDVGWVETLRSECRILREQIVERQPRAR